MIRKNAVSLVALLTVVLLPVQMQGQRLSLNESRDNASRQTPLPLAGVVAMRKSPADLLVADSGLLSELWPGVGSGLEGVQEPSGSADRVQAGDPWTAQEVLEAQKLASMLTMASPPASSPMVIQIGVPVLYRNSHIPGSVHMGQGSTDEGLAALAQAAKNIPRTRHLVIYCGCCPWKDCPNIRPAFKALRGMGFKHLSVLYLPNNFGLDWVRKGFPVEKAPKS